MLTFRTASVVRPGTALANPYLSERLADRRFGDWTISAQTMNFLEREIRARAPTRVLEFGSGLSTACLARYMAESAPDLPGPILISVEEDASFCTESRKLIAELGLEELASVHHAPLVTKEVAGRSVPTYDLAATILAELSTTPASLVFIDGPGKAGGPFGRWAVLHAVLPLLRRDFRFYLDDALTDSALESAKRWEDIPGVHIQGVALVGHGVLVGDYRP
jgi:predicted O-methyltransferase YrrM